MPITDLEHLAHRLKLAERAYRDATAAKLLDDSAAAGLRWRQARADLEQAEALVQGRLELERLAALPLPQGAP